MPAGRLWMTMNSQPRRSASTLSKDRVPATPGVYAWYRDGEAIYVGRAVGAGGLRGRVWKEHLDTGNDLSRSSFRRNVCEHLGIAATSRTRLRPTVMETREVAQVNEWIRQCEVAWISCSSDGDAIELEDRMKHEWKPLLTKR